MRRLTSICCLAVAIAGSAASAQSEGGGEAEEKKKWSNVTELSLVVTEGNSDTDSLAVKDKVERRWKRSRLEFTFDAVRSYSADDRYLLTDPGQTFLPGEDNPAVTATILVDPAKDLDVEKYFFESRLTREISGTRTWNAGGSWDRNEDAGILNRYIAFGGFGNHWRDREKLDIESSNGLSYTYREEETPDPEKDKRFAGFRGTASIDYQVLTSTLLSLDFTGNVNLTDYSDYSLDTTGAVAVAMSKRVALKVSLQFQYNSEPALEDVDVKARVRVEDPDGRAGSGDEFFVTVLDGGAEFEIGEDRVRKEQLDTVFRTSLQLNF
jgi:putative salt-induced outer membrane protein YdiY